MLRTTIATLALLLIAAAPAAAGSFTLEILGSDAIYLAGRTDVTIPDLGSTNSTFPLSRHASVRTEFVKETFPKWIAVGTGDVVYVVDPAIGWIHFYNGLGSASNSFGPEGNTSSGSNLSALGGLSSWNGPQGSLAGVFLSDAIPASGAPTGINYNVVSRDLTSYTPGLNQVFFIGDGVTSGGTHQQFVAPAGATRLFFGIPDGFSFVGTPGAYEDNDGSYTIRVGTNEIPTANVVPLPGSMSLGLAMLGVLAIGRRLRRRK